jgi:purine-nucleoside phosphorylase
MSAFAAFARLVDGLTPRTAIVLGSGLGGVIGAFRELGSIAFGQIPGLFQTTVRGHSGQLAVGLWDEIPVLLFLGRLHFYEGHSREVLIGPVRVAANFGTKVFVLTNAAGGINPLLKPGSLMAIRKHIKLVGSNAWRGLAAQSETIPGSSYSPRLIEAMHRHEAAVGRELLVGVYAALTGPSYETPAEIRALAACGADAVGMSTALEAEAAAELGQEVAAISCVTNAAAGLSNGPLDHAEVLDNAKLAIERLSAILTHIVHAT